MSLCSCNEALLLHQPLCGPQLGSEAISGVAQEVEIGCSKDCDYGSDAAQPLHDRRSHTVGSSVSDIGRS